MTYYVLREGDVARGCGFGLDVLVSRRFKNLRKFCFRVDLQNIWEGLGLGLVSVSGLNISFYELIFT